MLREHELTWKNEDLYLYHGTDEESALNIIHFGVDLSRCSALRDFGQGFYTTTHLEQAKNWGITKATRLRKRGRKSVGCVLELQVSRDWLGGLDTLVFLRPAVETGFPQFVRFCRAGDAPHRSEGGDYQVVYGPVAQWNEMYFDPKLTLFVIENCDQVSFHNEAVTAPTSKLLAKIEKIWSER